MMKKNADKILVDYSYCRLGYAHRHYPWGDPRLSGSIRLSRTWPNSNSRMVHKTMREFFLRCGGRFETGTPAGSPLRGESPSQFQIAATTALTHNADHRRLHSPQIASKIAQTNHGREKRV